VISQVLTDALSALDSRDRGLPFSVLNLIPLLGELGLAEPKLKLGQFFDFRLGIDFGGLFNLRYPVQAKRDPGLSSRNLLFQDALPKSVLAKACNYTFTLWARLSRFLEHPELLKSRLNENSVALEWCLKAGGSDSKILRFILASCGHRSCGENPHLGRVSL
jgi:hypothetical protein